MDVLRTMINKKTPSPFIVFKTICDLKPLCAAQQLNVTLTKQFYGKYFFSKVHIFVTITITATF